MIPSTDASTRNWRRITRGVAPSALRSPISRMRSVTETNMMFMTPMPPTMSEMAAMPPSRMVSVWSTDVLAAISDCSEVMVKSASVGVGDAVELRAAGGPPPGRRAVRSADERAWTAMELTELREVPPKMRSAPVVMGMISVSSGSDVLDEELDEPVEVSTPTTVTGTPLTSTVWPTGSPRVKSSDAVVAPSTPTAV